MFHIRVGNHALKTEMLLLGGLELLLLGLVGLLSLELADPNDITLPAKLSGAGMFAIAATISGLAMGLYDTSTRERLLGFVLRWAVALFLLTVTGIGLLARSVPGFSFQASALAVASVAALPVVLATRLSLAPSARSRVLKRRVLFVGAGKQALRINERMRREADRRGFDLLGFLPIGGEDLVSSHGAFIVDLEGRSLRQFCRERHVDEIVVAADERRLGSLAQFPQQDLLDCKLSGISVVDVLDFFESEAKRMDLDILRPGWLLYSDGFEQGAIRSISKRMFDILASSALLALVWPFMLLTVLAIKLEEGCNAPIVYRQLRVGRSGQIYGLLKFRSMRADAERDHGAVWAEANDPRVTRVGHWIRAARIDELLQLFNVLKGTMSFVGPRPERPEFVDSLATSLPFYTERHRIKPGISGWAQIHYPYGSSPQDAKGKLELDLYYVKNHSLLLDVLILIRTIETILLSAGAR